jgi:transposase InsO family protein
MYLHANAKLGLAGRFILVTAIEEGMTLRAAAAALSVSPATAHRWWHRWREAGEEARRTRSCLRDRSSRPRRSPRQLAPELEEAIYACRRKTGWGRGWSPARLASRTRRSGRCFAGRDLASAASGQGAGKPLRVALPRRSAAHGCLPLRALPATRPPRHRRPLPVLARSERRDASRLRLRHAIVDDHSRLVYVELHDDERAATVTGFVERALAFFAEHGIGVKRLMTDNGFSYVKNRSLRELLARRGIRHLTTRPYWPRTNGKVERFHQTMAREWAYGLAYRSHRQRNQALPHWLDHYNRHRPHSSLGDRPPITRVHNVRG